MRLFRLSRLGLWDGGVRDRQGHSAYRCFYEGPRVYTQPCGPFCLYEFCGVPHPRFLSRIGWLFLSHPFLLPRLFCLAIDASAEPPHVTMSHEKGRLPKETARNVRPKRTDQPCITFATSAAKSSSAFSMPSPTSRRTKPVISAPASFAAFSTVRSGFTTKA